MRKLLLWLSIVALALLAFPAIAFAQGGSAGNPADIGFPIAWPALLSMVIIGFVVPHITAFATDESAHPFLKSAIAAVALACGAIGTYLADVKGVPDWKTAVGVFVGSLLVSVGYRKGIDPGTVEPLQTSGLHVGHRP